MSPVRLPILIPVLCLCLLAGSCSDRSTDRRKPPRHPSTTAAPTAQAQCPFSGQQLDERKFQGMVDQLARSTGDRIQRAGADPMLVGFQQDGLVTPPGSDPDAAFARMRALGAQVARITLHWNVIARDCGSASEGALRRSGEPCYDWSAYDRAVMAAHRQGLDLVVSITGVPDWVPGASSSSSQRWQLGTGAQFDRVSARYADFAQATAAHYLAMGRPITGWTIWNEPNSVSFWQPFTSQGPDAAPRRYAQLFNQAAAAIKRVDPRAQVAAGPTAPKPHGLKPGTYIAAVQRAGLDRRLIDAWAHNPYPGARVSPRERALQLPAIGIGNLDDLFHILDSHASTRGLPVWATEFAYESHPQEPRQSLGVPWEVQARYLAEGMEILQRSGRVRYAIWYVLSDPAEGGYPDRAAMLADWQSGVLDASNHAKLAAWMYQRPITLSLHPPDRRGRNLAVWARTNVGSPGSARLMWKREGGAWRPIPGQRRRGRVVEADIARPRGGAAISVALADDGPMGRGLQCMVEAS